MFLLVNKCFRTRVDGGRWNVFTILSEPPCHKSCTGCRKWGNLLTNCTTFINYLLHLFPGKFYDHNQEIQIITHTKKKKICKPSSWQLLVALLFFCSYGQFNWKKDQWLDISEKLISNKCAVNSAGRSPQLEYFEGWQNQLFSHNGFLYVAVSTEIKSSFKNLHTLTYIDSIIKNLSGEWRMEITLYGLQLPKSICNFLSKAKKLVWTHITISCTWLPCLEESWPRVVCGY